MAVPLDVHRFVSRALTELPEGDRITVISVPAPVAAPVAFLRLQPRDKRFFWGSPGGASFSGGGAVRTIRVQGENRYDELRTEVERLWSELGSVSHPNCRPVPPRVFGGLAFHSGDQGPVWDEFGDGCFTLPRWCYALRNGRAYLSLAVRGDTDGTEEGQRQLLDELEIIFRVLATEEEQSALLENPRLLDATATVVHRVEFPQWEQHVDAIRRAITSGEFQKIVAAHRCDLALTREVDDLEVLSRLVVQPLCTRFLFGRETMSFVGASPEVLFDKRGSLLRTEALAGTTRCPAGSDADAPASELFESAKDRSEHAFVVGEIARILEPFCEKLRWSERPRVHRIREILHLQTPFKARLKEAVHPIELLDALHPTPSVGGLPTAAAAEWIASNEADGRGWYTGPVGWMDASGDARFVVAIRCGLVGGSRVHVFTGAGIVSASRADAEYAETNLKRVPLLRALGLGEPQVSELASLPSLASLASTDSVDSLDPFPLPSLAEIPASPPSSSRLRDTGKAGTPPQSEPEAKRACENE